MTSLTKSTTLICSQTIQLRMNPFGPSVHKTGETGSPVSDETEHPLKKAFVILGDRHERKIKVLYGAVNMTLGTELRKWPNIEIVPNVEIFLRYYLIQAYGF